MPKAKLTSAYVLELPFCSSGQEITFDTSLPGFGVRVTASRKTYIAQGRAGGKTVRVTLGPSNVLSCEEARKRAKKALGQLADGVNVNEAEKEAKATIKAKGLTFGDAVKAFFASRTLRAGTERDYRKVLASNFTDWNKTPLQDITPKMMLDRFNAITGRGAPAMANLAGRIFCSVWNFAREETALPDGSYILPESPTRRIGAVKRWNKVTRRQTYVAAAQLPAWFAAVRGLTSDRNPEDAAAFADYFELTMRTGLRKNEGLSLDWSSVNLKAGTFRIEKEQAKNGVAHVLPMSRQIRDIFKRRLEATGGTGKVFCGTGKDGRITNAPGFHRMVREMSGCKHSCHDLRRSFSSVAERENVSAFTLKKLLNHVNGSVTEGYIVADPERLRDAMQRISDAMDSASAPVQSNELAQSRANICTDNREMIL